MDTSTGPCQVRTTVVVPCYQAEETIGELLDALMKQRDCGLFDLVVVDNGSTDRTIAQVESARQAWLGRAVEQRGSVHDVRQYHEPVRGPAAARNRGIRGSTTRVIAFLDADCLPPADWLAKLLAALDADPAIDAIGGNLRTSNPRSVLEEFAERQGILNVDHFYKHETARPPMVLTANLCVRRTAFDRVGVFDETLWVGEDADWCWRLQWAGGQLGYCPDAVVEHRHRSSVGRLARQMYSYGKGSVAVFARHRDRLGRRTLVQPIQFWFLAKALLKIALAPLWWRDRYRRVVGVLELVRHGSFLAGRIVGAVRYRVVAL